MAKIHDYKLQEKKVYIQEVCASCGDKECYPVSTLKEARRIADLAEAGEAKIIAESDDFIVFEYGYYSCAVCAELDSCEF